MPMEAQPERLEGPVTAEEGAAIMVHSSKALPTQWEHLYAPTALPNIEQDASSHNLVGLIDPTGPLRRVVGLLQARTATTSQDQQPKRPA